jgi:hypothetical protein
MQIDFFCQVATLQHLIVIFPQNIDNYFIKFFLYLLYSTEGKDFLLLLETFLKFFIYFTTC